MAPPSRAFVPAALDPACAPIDAQQARERLAFAARFARLIRFHPHDGIAPSAASGREPAHWQPFLLKDPAIVLAYIAGTDDRGLHAEFEAMSPPSATSAPSRRTAAPVLLRRLRDVFTTLAHWAHWLARQEQDFPLAAFLSRRIEDPLSPALTRMWALHAELAGHGLADAPDPAWYRSFVAPWRVRGPVGPDAADPDPDGAADRCIGALHRCARETLEVMVQTIDAARQQYESVARQDTRHPDTALLRVFVDLMRYPQEAVNRIGRRHLDFYYRRVLDIEPRKAVADRVVVFAQVAAGQSGVRVPAGTRFAAGKAEDGSPLAYASVETAVVDAARIAAAYHLKAQAGTSVCGFAPGLHAAQLADVEQLQHDAAGHARDQAAFATPVARPQGLSFGLASPMLLLEGGHRHLQIVCELEQDLRSLPADWAQGWRFWFTGAAGWFDASLHALPPHAIDAQDGQPAGLCLEWILPADAPAILPFSGAQRDPLSPWPQLRCCLPPAIGACPWPRMTAIRFDVVVRELPCTSLHSDAVPLTPLPAAPFGPVPRLGQRACFGSREAFAKPVDKLVLHLAWHPLPADLGDWYRDYNAWQAAERPDWPAFDDRVHTIAWECLQAGAWRPLGADVPAGCTEGALFQPGGVGQFRFRLGADHRPCPDLAREPLAGPAQARDGHLAMRLTGPAQAFGHAQYPQVLIWAGQRGATGMPNPPLSPQLREVTLEYASAVRIPVLPGAAEPAAPCPLQWFHEGPWGRWLAWENTRATPVSAPLAPGVPVTGPTPLPALPSQGCLLLALQSAPRPGVLRLYAAVADDGGGRGFAAWQYAGTGWRAVEVWRDDTAGLSTSGLIELSLQADRAPLPWCPDDDRLWLAITPAPAPDSTPDNTPDTTAAGGWRDLRLTLLGTQPLVLERQDLAPDALHRPTLAAGVIAKSPLPALAALRQPLPSWGGRAAEHQAGFDDDASYYRRVSQRLLHKGRALTPRDLVLLAHEWLPELHRVEVLPPTAGGHGAVRLGVVPWVQGPEAPNAWSPSVSPAVRERLAARLQQLGSAAASVQVDNLRQRTITIGASLLLTREAQAAWPALRRDWNQALRLYLSPWIRSAMPQYELRHGLARAGLLRRLAGFPGVLAVVGLRIGVDDDDSISDDVDVLRAPPGAMWVSAAQHALQPAEG